MLFIPLFRTKIKSAQNVAAPIVNLAAAYGNVNNTKVPAIATQIVDILFDFFTLLEIFFLLEVVRK